MLIHHIPKATKIRIIGDSFKHHRRGTIGQWSINNIGMPCDPAQICRAPINVSWFIIKHYFMCERSIGQISTCGMKYSFWFSRRTRRIKNKKWIFRIHNFRLTFSIHSRGGFMPPDISFRIHTYRFSSATYYNHMFYGGRVYHSIISIHFHGNILFYTADARILCN